MVLHRPIHKSVFDSLGMAILAVVIFSFTRDLLGDLREAIVSSNFVFWDMFPGAIILFALGSFLWGFFRSAVLIFYPNVVLNKIENKVSVHSHGGIPLSNIEELRIREISTDSGYEYKTSLVLKNGKRLWLNLGNDKDANTQTATQIADFLEVPVVISS